MIVAGVGLSSTCRAADLVALVCRAETVFGVRATRLAAYSPKAHAPAVQQSAVLLDMEIIVVAKAAMAEVQSRCLTASSVVQAAIGLASVAEACALAAVGPGGRLLGPRLANARATCAFAVSEDA